MTQIVRSTIFTSWFSEKKIIAVECVELDFRALFCISCFSIILTVLFCRPFFHIFSLVCMICLTSSNVASVFSTSCFRFLCNSDLFYLFLFLPLKQIYLWLRLLFHFISVNVNANARATWINNSGLGWSTTLSLSTEFKVILILFAYFIYCIALSENVYLNKKIECLMLKRPSPWNNIYFNHLQIFFSFALVFFLTLHSSLILLWITSRITNFYLILFLFWRCRKNRGKNRWFECESCCFSKIVLIFFSFAISDYRWIQIKMNWPKKQSKQ